MKQLKLMLYVLTVLAVFFPLQAYSQSSCRLGLDDFANTEIGIVEVNAATPLVQVTDDGSPDALGGFRNITLGPFENNNQQQTANVRATIDPGAQSLALDADAGTRAPLNIEYSANGAGLNVNLLPFEVFTLTVFRTDEPFEVTVTLRDGNANSAILMQTTPDEVRPSADPPLEIQFPLQSFVNIENVDLSDIDRIELLINPLIVSTDLTLESPNFQCSLPAATAVPTMSPVGFALLTLGLLLLLASLFVLKNRQRHAGRSRDLHD